MKVIVAVVVYDRMTNVSEWCRCWKMCRKDNAELYIIHNIPNEHTSEVCRQLCHSNNVNYIKRDNIGMDIGALQDVFNERLVGFPNDWNYLLWTTDDNIPMNKTFLNPYLTLIKNPSIGVVCMEISHEVKTHIRTTGFMISKELSKKITFDKDPIETKQDCYNFEHKSPNAFYEQIIALGKKVVQANSDHTKGFMWDTHIRANFRRWQEHYKAFPR